MADATLNLAWNKSSNSNNELRSSEHMEINAVKQLIQNLSQLSQWLLA